MDNTELMQQIRGSKSGKDREDEERTVKTVKLLVFHIEEKYYALYAEEVREIVLDVPLFFIPFVPSYVCGLINRHGEPYTVFDLNMLFERKKLESSTYLVLNLEDDQVAFLISDILEIIKVPETDVHQITSKSEHGGFFLGSITSKDDQEVFILNIQTIFQRLESDLE
jgi:purine-binding chemotaxis protein CheW